MMTADKTREITFEALKEEIKKEAEKGNSRLYLRGKSLGVDMETFLTEKKGYRVHWSDVFKCNVISW